MSAKEKTACAGTQTVNAGNDKTAVLIKSLDHIITQILVVR